MLLQGECTEVVHPHAHLDIGVLGKLICTGETSRASANDDDVCLCILVQVLEVTAGHCAAHLPNNLPPKSMHSCVCVIRTNASPETIGIQNTWTVPDAQ